MITREQIKEREAELQETVDEFYSALRVAIRPNDTILDDNVRAHALRCAKIYISQVQFQMNEILEQCQPVAKASKPEQRASADPGLRDLDLSELGIDKEQAANFDRIIVEQDTIAREDTAWLEAEQGS